MQKAMYSKSMQGRSASGRPQPKWPWQSPHAHLCKDILSDQTKTFPVILSPEISLFQCHTIHLQTLMVTCDNFLCCQRVVSGDLLQSQCCLEQGMFISLKFVALRGKLVNLDVRYTGCAGAMPGANSCAECSN
jgi:hypothetical protein